MGPGVEPAETEKLRRIQQTDAEGTVLQDIALPPAGFY
jgi:hypothetical protein